MILVVYAEGCTSGSGSGLLPRISSQKISTSSPINVTMLIETEYSGQERSQFFFI